MERTWKIFVWNCVKSKRFFKIPNITIAARAEIFRRVQFFSIKVGVNQSSEFLLDSDKFRENGFWILPYDSGEIQNHITDTIRNFICTSSKNLCHTENLSYQSWWRLNYRYGLTFYRIFFKRERQDHYEKLSENVFIIDCLSLTKWKHPLSYALLIFP